ncbi:hypothetical protein BR93DRAFT_85832 [Coniochaeta sp. PMI_546]|nr:hypothetical protein BR93DRAFT_85832 [Coniochaeta sp. PMI_546]
MSDTRSTADYRRRHRSRRHRRRDPAPGPDESDSGYSTPASDTASRATTRSSRRHKRGGPGDALVVRDQYHVQRLPGAHQASEYSDDYDEYTVGGDGLSRGGGRQRYREKDRGRDRERGLLIVIAAFMVGLIFCLRETRSRR